MDDDRQSVAAAIRKILPPAIGFAGGALARAQIALFPAEEELIRASAAKRIVHFTAGRCYARQALRQIDVDPVAILVGRNHAPMWPAGVVGSISHCDAFCGVVVARRESVRAIGLDVEDSSPLDSNLMATVWTGDELAHAANGSPLGAGDAAKLLFIIKESFYKAYAPATREFLEFQDVRATIDWTKHCFRIALVNSRKPDLFGKRSLAGRFGSKSGTAFAISTVFVGDDTGACEACA
jgi:4'-phosphopantetheinyl transferase EntD